MGKRQRHLDAAPLSLAALPSACLAAVLAHLVGPGAACHALYPEPFALTEWHRALALYARVSREWRAVAAQLAAQLTRSVARIDVTAAVAQHPSRPGSFASIDRHASASDLRLVMRSVVTVSDTESVTATWFTVPAGYDDAVQLHKSSCVMRSMGSIAIDWSRLLTPRTPHLIRLDLSQTPLDCAQLGSVLLAASTSCPLVRVLALPRQSKMRFSEDNEARETNLNELYGALQRWHRANGGLVHLRIPFGRFDENTAVRLLRALIAYCPAIEYLDGWQDTYCVDDDGLASCEAYWPAPARLWGAFWQKCTKLRAFHTVAMPFDDEYVRMVHPNTSLETLVVAIDSAKARHFEVSRESLLEFVMSFHGLRRLRLEIPFVRDDVWDPRTSIDDAFVSGVVSSSPELREFRLQCLDSRVLFAISAWGVDRLARLEHLEIVELQRLQAFTVAMGINLLRVRSRLELAVSFASGVNEAWQLLRFLADSCTYGEDHSTSFMVSLWCLGSGYGDYGIQQHEAALLVQRLATEDIQVDVHSDRRSDSPAVLDLKHLKLSHHAQNQVRRGVKRNTGARHFDFPICRHECIAEDSIFLHS